jgi:anti-sigma-K factor RskA
VSGHDAGPYLLGALEPDEARAFIDHLERCAICRDEVAALAPVLDALPASAPAQRVPRALRRRVLRAARAEPKASPRPRTNRFGALRRSAPAGWLALAASMAAAAVVVQVATPGPPERVIGHAQLRVAGGHTRGELVVTRLPALPADRTYEVWLQSGTRPPVPSALFGVTARGTADVAVPADLHGVTRLLVTVEPRGGSVHPTTPAVIQLPLVHVSRS